MMAEKQSGVIYEPVRIASWGDEARFVVPGVNYRGEKGTYAIFEKMTPPMTQDKLSEVYETEKARGNPVPADMSLVWAIGERGYDLRNENPETSRQLSKLLKQGMRRFPNTMTRLHYSPKESSAVHNVGTSDQYFIKGDIIGPDGFIDKIQDIDFLKSVLERSDVEKVNRVSNWINGTRTYVSRENKKPKQFEKRVARFGAGGDGLVLCCSGNFHYEYPAFRVLVQVE